MYCMRGKEAKAEMEKVAFMKGVLSLKIKQLPPIIVRI